MFTEQCRPMYIIYQIQSSDDWTVGLLAQLGVSFIILTMDILGVSIRGIYQITGHHFG